MLVDHTAVLQKSTCDRKGDRGSLGINSIFLHRNISCDPLLEPSRGEGSNEGLIQTFFLEK